MHKQDTIIAPANVDMLKRSNNSFTGNISAQIKSNTLWIPKITSEFLPIYTMYLLWQFWVINTTNCSIIKEYIKKVYDLSPMIWSELPAAKITPNTNNPNDAIETNGFKFTPWTIGINLSLIRLNSNATNIKNNAGYNALNANGTNWFSNVLLQNCWIGIDNANKIAIIIILAKKYLIFAIK